MGKWIFVVGAVTISIVFGLYLAVQVRLDEISRDVFRLKSSYAALEKELVACKEGQVGSNPQYSGLRQQPQRLHWLAAAAEPTTPVYDQPVRIRVLDEKNDLVPNAQIVLFHRDLCREVGRDEKGKPRYSCRDIASLPLLTGENGMIMHEFRFTRQPVECVWAVYVGPDIRRVREPVLRACGEVLYSADGAQGTFRLLPVVPSARYSQ